MTKRKKRRRQKPRSFTPIEPIDRDEALRKYPPRKASDFQIGQRWYLTKPFEPTWSELRVLSIDEKTGTITVGIPEKTKP